MNKVFIAGHLGSDPEVRHTPAGLKIISFTVAVNVKRKAKEETFWYRVSVLGDRFDKMVTYLKKGSAVMIQGDLFANIWTDKNGQSRLGLEITADSISFSPFGRPAEREGQQGGAGAGQSYPRQGYGQANQYAVNPIANNQSESEDLDGFVEGFGATYGAGNHDESADDLPF